MEKERVPKRMEGGHGKEQGITSIFSASLSKFKVLRFQDEEPQRRRRLCFSMREGAWSLRWVLLPFFSSRSLLFPIFLSGFWVSSLFFPFPSLGWGLGFLGFFPSPLYLRQILLWMIPPVISKPPILHTYSFFQFFLSNNAWTGGAPNLVEEGDNQAYNLAL